MKICLHAFIMCMSMFTAIPMPQVWDADAKDKMLLFLPFVGLIIGAIWAVSAYLCRVAAVAPLVMGVILCACPFVVTGYLHLDGYMDVTDAVKSWREPARRREILKDSHVGSFAVIAVAMLMLAQFAFFASARAEADVRILVFIPCVSRCASALAVTCLKPMSSSQYVGRTRSGGKIALLLAILLLTLSVATLLCGKYVLALIGCMTGYALALARAYRSLEGMNGDIAGYALTIGELCAVAVYSLI